MAVDDLHLLRSHVEACWGVSVPPLAVGDVAMPAAADATPWVLYCARLGGGEVRLWRDMEPAGRRALSERVHAALAHEGAPARDGVSGEVLFRRTVPAPQATPAARRLGPEDRALIEAFEPGETAYWLATRRGPLFGVVEAGRLLSIAHSSRGTQEACELGINTLPHARRRGLARACVLAWAEAVAAEGLEPLYSANWSDAASLALARACGYRAVAVAAKVGPPAEPPSGPVG